MEDINPQEITKHMSKFVDDTPNVAVTEVDIEMNNLNNYSEEHIDIGHVVEESSTDGVIININQEIDSENGDGNDNGNDNENDNENGNDDNDDNGNDNDNNGNNGNGSGNLNIPRIV